LAKQYEPGMLEQQSKINSKSKG